MLLSLGVALQCEMYCVHYVHEKCLGLRPTVCRITVNNVDISRTVYFEAVTVAFWMYGRDTSA